MTPVHRQSFSQTAILGVLSAVVTKAENQFTIRANVRVIVATKCDPEAAVVIVNLSEDRGNWPLFVALRKAQPTT
jgi:hypothetical protein